MENNNSEVSLTDISTESQSNIEISVTESVTMEGATTHSTPIQNKQYDSNDIMNMMQLLLEKQNVMLEQQNVKFNELKQSIERMGRGE